MVRVRKRDGTLQEFDRQKLQLSIEKAGASRADAINTAYRIGARVEEGTTTNQIRKDVSTELMALSEVVAQTYDAQRPKIMTRQSTKRH